MDIMSKFNLPKYVKGKSFSEASAIIAKKFKDRSDPESVDTLNELQGRLQQAQEFVKAEQEKLSAPQGQPQGQPQEQHQMPDGSMMPGAQHSDQGNSQGGAQELASMMPQQGQEQMPMNNNLYDLGGLMGGPGDKNKKKKDSSKTELSSNDLSEINNSTGIEFNSELSNSLFEKVDNTPLSKPIYKSMNYGNLYEDAFKVQERPDGRRNVSPSGTSTYNYDDFKERASRLKKLNPDLNLDVQYEGTNMYKSGGRMLANMYDNGGSVHNATPHPHSAQERPMIEAPYNIPDSGKLDSYGTSGGLENNAYKTPNQKFQKDQLDITENYEDYLEKNKSSKNKTKFNPAELLRYAPSAMSAFKLASLDKPTQVGMDRLGNRYNEQLVDERSMQNAVQQGVLNNRDALMASAGGSGSRASANLLASQLQGTKSLSSAQMQSEDMNNAEKRAGQTFNRDTDKSNLNQSNMQTEFQLEQDAAYQQNRSKLLAQIGADLGGIGQEELFKRYPELMGLSYNSRGRHIKAK
jgi:hypothetical protein